MSKYACGKGHPFTDGNKRTGFLLASYYLKQVGHPAPEQLDVEQAENLCMRISAGPVEAHGQPGPPLRPGCGPRG
jgi:prophage maintenance system killer protein